jgi:hypothetical protein
MSPYLEYPTLWPGIHNGLIAALQLSLAPQLRPRYYVALEEWVHVTEPDQRTFVRSGEPMPLMDDGRASAYRILVSRGERRPNATLYLFGVRQPIPTFPLPLKPGDQEPLVDMGQILHDLYDQASYDLRLDYTGDPDPPLTSADAAWAEQLLRQQGLRR